MTFYTFNKMPREVKNMLKEAWEKHWWIYDQLGETWYTPQEFKAKWTRLVTTHNLTRFRARSPHLGLMEAIGRANKALEEVADLQLKLQSYFSFDLKRKSDT